MAFCVSVTQTFMMPLESDTGCLLTLSITLDLSLKTTYEKNFFLDPDGGGGFGRAKTLVELALQHQ